MILPLAGGLVAAGALGGVGWALWFGRDGQIASPEDAALAVESALAGFEVADVVLGADGAGALAIARDGRLAAVKRRGGRAAVCEVGWADVRPTGDGTIVQMGERRFGSVMLARVDALDLRRLAGQMAFPFALARRR